MDSKQVSDISSTAGGIVSMLPVPGAPIVGMGISAIGSVASMIMGNREAKAKEEALKRQMADSQSLSQNTNLLNAANVTPKVLELGFGGIANKILIGTSTNRSEKDLGMIVEGDHHEDPSGGTVTAQGALAEKGEFTYLTSDGKKLVFSNRI